MNVTGKTKIYAKTFSNGNTAYSRKVSFKDSQGAWCNVYEPVNFRGGDPELPSRCEINVTEAFESGYIDNKGKPQLKLVIMAYELCEDPSEAFTELTESLPF